MLLFVDFYVLLYQLKRETETFLLHYGIYEAGSQPTIVPTITVTLGHTVGNTFISTTQSF